MEVKDKQWPKLESQPIQPTTMESRDKGRGH